jgi:transposase
MIVKTVEIVEERRTGQASQPRLNHARLFVGSDRGGQTAAACFSTLAGAKRHRIEPFAYVRDLLVAISTGEPDWSALLPDVWIAAHPEHFLTMSLGLWGASRAMPRCAGVA